MASQTQGIQQLLAAEKRAAEKVAEARKSKLHFSTTAAKLCPTKCHGHCRYFKKKLFFNFFLPPI